MNRAISKQVISEVKNVIITKSLLVRNFSGIIDDCLFDSIDKKTRRKLNFISFLSILKNKLHFWKDENYYFVLNLWTNGYYHWMTEAAVKFVVFEQELKMSVVIIPENPPPFIQEFLSVWGINRYRMMKGNCFIKNLKIISNPVSGHPDADHLNKLRIQLLDKVEDSHVTFEKIYISRRLAKARKVLNEDEVKFFLEETGFQYIELENFPWQEQVNLFRRCRTLISIHGAGLTNAIFMPIQSKVIEIYPKNEAGETSPNLCYQTLCRTIGLTHNYLFAKREKPDSKPDFHSDNVVVDIEELRTFISGIEN